MQRLDPRPNLRSGPVPRLFVTAIGIGALLFGLARNVRAEDGDAEVPAGAEGAPGAEGPGPSEEGDGSADGQPIGTPRAPVRSMAHEAPSDAAIASALASVANSWLFRKADAALAVVDLETGRQVYGVESERLLNPASTMKVVTSAAALRNLGPSYRFTTDVFYTGEIEPDGTLKGDLYIKGHGDPTFVSETLWKMINDLQTMGVERVDGSVYFDDTFHTGSVMIPGWDKQEDIDKGTSYFSSLSALSLNANTVVLIVRPAAEVGSPARVDLETPLRGNVEVDNQVKTGPPGTRRFVDVEREVLPNQDTKFTLTGSLPVNDTNRVWIRRSVADPTGHFIAAFHKKMDERGIRVTGRYRRAVTPPEAESLFSVRSEALSKILAEMNKSSLNFVAEQVLRTLGAEVTGTGSTEAGLSVISEYLRSIGVPPGDIVLVNGSGLSRQAKLKPTVLTSVLVDMGHDPVVGSEFASSLAIAGTDGTLWSRLREDPGRVRGKTGTLDGVHCLTGYVDIRGGRRYAFAFLSNNYRTAVRAVRDVHDDFARKMFEVGP